MVRRRGARKRIFHTGRHLATLPILFSKLRPVSYLMGELLDSSDEAHISTAAFGERVRSFLDRQPWDEADVPMICRCLRSTRQAS